MKFKIMSSKGDAACDYTPEVAEVKFEELAEANLMPFGMVKGGGGLKPMRQFNREAEEVIWMPKIMGG